MPTIPVDSAGNYLYYEDTGAPDGRTDYHTIFLVHGYIFHGAIFRPLLQYAKTYNLRLVVINQRDYLLSSPFDTQDIKDATDPTAQADLMARVGAQLATFIYRFIQEQRIPPTRSENGDIMGGATMLAWSLGNLLAWSLLGNAASFEQKMLDCLEKYLRSVLVYDAPNVTLGLPLPEEIYLPFRDPTIEPTELASRFMVWVSGFYPAISDLEMVTVGQLSDRPALGETSDDPSTKSTFERMNQEQREAVADGSIHLRSGNLLLTMSPAVYYANYEKSLFNTQGVLNSVDVLVWWCDMSVSDTVYGAKLIWDDLKNPHSKGHQRRTRIEKLEGANHYFHWEKPELFVRLLAERL